MAKKLKKIPVDLVSYIQIETEAIKKDMVLSVLSDAYGTFFRKKAATLQ